MTLLDFWQHADYDVKYYVYIKNIYGQYIPVCSKYIRDLRIEPNHSKWFLALNYKIDSLYVCKNGDIQVDLIDKHFNQQIEDWWTTDKKVIETWNNSDKTKRPFLWKMETEKFTLKK